MTLLTMQDKVTLAERDVTLAQTRLLQLTGQTVDSVVGSLPATSGYRPIQPCLKKV
ncbi:Uncharacterised protein [Cedecea neteri]|uniref:Uncharacterized protein n=1 Tax=Cedecea neteri TaxID=158822 RepID=A0A2X2V585_9ENTR|nr:Uncharacterised protein [Cedecea neteri]